MIHHRSWFPFVVVGLSLTLALVVLWGFVTRSTAPDASGSPSAGAEAVKPVNDDEYRAQAAVIISGLVPVLARAEAGEQLAQIDLAMSGMLALIVPAERREMHQELVFSLNKMRLGLANSDDTLYAEGRARFDELLDQYSWLN